MFYIIEMYACRRMYPCSSELALHAPAACSMWSTLLSVLHVCKVKCMVALRAGTSHIVLPGCHPDDHEWMHSLAFHSKGRKLVMTNKHHASTSLLMCIMYFRAHYTMLSQLLPLKSRRWWLHESYVCSDKDCSTGELATSNWIEKGVKSRSSASQGCDGFLLCQGI